MLSERERLETLMSNLRDNIDHGMGKLQDLENTIDKVLALKGTMEANKHYKVKRKFRIQVISSYQCNVFFTNPCTPLNQVTKTSPHPLTNCTTCSFTCHNPCDCPPGECTCMRGGNCVACPGRCPWTHHYTGTKYFEYQIQEVEETCQDMKVRYDMAADDRKAKVTLCRKLMEDYNEHKAHLLRNIMDIKVACNRLEALGVGKVRDRSSTVTTGHVMMFSAGFQDALTGVEYIDMLIEAEMMSNKYVGFLNSAYLVPHGHYYCICTV